MFSKIAKIGASLAAAALGVVSTAGDAAAININTHGAAFQPYNAGQANDIDYLTSGVRTSAATDRFVVASVARSPVTTPSQSFYIDGSNSPGKTTSFTLYAFDYTGTLQSSVSFSSNLSAYSTFQTLSTISTYSYVSLLATLPASYGGTVRGVTALQ
jgi:hypothetical protein